MSSFFFPGAILKALWLPLCEVSGPASTVMASSTVNQFILLQQKRHDSQFLRILTRLLEIRDPATQVHPRIC